MEELNFALTHAMQLVGLAKLAIEARDDAKAKSALMELTLKLNEVSISALASTEKAMTLQNALREVQDENRALQLQAEERQRYTLAELCPGAYAYKRKPAQEGDDTPPHYLCQPCYDKGVKAVLRFQEARTGTDAHYTCPEGGTPHGIKIRDTGLPHRMLY